MTFSGVYYGSRAWLLYHVEIWSHNPVSNINFNKTCASAKEQMIMPALGKDFFIYPNFLVFETGISFMQAPVLGIWEDEASNLSLTVDLCEEKRLKERYLWVLYWSHTFLSG